MGFTKVSSSNLYGGMKFSRSGLATSTSSITAKLRGTGGTQTTVISDGITYLVHTFTGNGAFTPTSSGFGDVYIIGGGGAGSYGSNGTSSSIASSGVSPSISYSAGFGYAATNQSNTGRGGTSGNGFIGGTGVSASYAERGGGGGGATAVGNNSGGSGGAGGAGITLWSSSFGNATYGYKFAGGGGGGGARDTGGGSGVNGGGNGAGGAPATGSAAPANYGGGGGAGSNGGHGGGGGEAVLQSNVNFLIGGTYTVTIGAGGPGASTGGAGGSGTVIIRYVE